MWLRLCSIEGMDEKFCIKPFDHFDELRTGRVRVRFLNLLKAIHELVEGGP